jgi:hypothetical protein
MMMNNFQQAAHMNTTATVITKDSQIPQESNLPNHRGAELVEELERRLREDGQMSAYRWESQLDKADWLALMEARRAARKAQ